jgi:predicted AAA+ superfamily ATPase
MEILENLYAFEIKKLDFIERKVEISHQNIHLFGPPKSGKTYIALDYLAGFNPDEYLYIDLHDMRIAPENLENIDTFVQQNAIEVVVLDNWDGKPYIYSKEVQQICISRTAMDAVGFESCYVPALDFEEYILFEHTPASQITHTFNNFIKYGTIPQIIRANHDLKSSHIQSLLYEVFDNPTERMIFVFLIRSTGLAFSLHQIFQKLKKEMKLSKDKFYHYVERFIMSRMVYFLPKFNQPRAAKKVYTYDFALRDGVTFEKNFTSVYENMILIELMKFFDEIYYIGLIDFYIPAEGLGIIAMPFSSKSAITTLLTRIPKEITINRIEIITMGYEDAFTYQDVEIEVIPYWTWALKDEK